MLRIVTLIIVMLLSVCELSAEVHDLARRGNVEKLKEVIEADSLLLKATDANYFEGTPLHVAVQFGQVQVVTLLLAAGAEVNARDARGATPLHLAHDKEVVTLLLAAGAEVNARNMSGATPLHRATKPLRESMVQTLLNAKAETDPRDETGTTPLVNVVSIGALPAAALLRQHGADTGVITSEGYSLLMLAVHHNRLEVCRWLLEEGAPVNQQGRSGMTALHLAAQAGKLEFVRLLLAHGADPTIRMAKGKTALDLLMSEAARPFSLRGETSTIDAIIALLNDGKPEIAFVNDMGYSLLHAAVATGDIARVKMLLDRGFPIALRSLRSAQTPLHIGAGCYDGTPGYIDGGGPLHRVPTGPEMIATLLDAGAPINARDRQGNTPLYTAVRRNLLNNVRLFSITALICTVATRWDARQSVLPARRRWFICLSTVERRLTRATSREPRRYSLSNRV